MDIKIDKVIFLDVEVAPLMSGGGEGEGFSLFSEAKR